MKKTALMLMMITILSKVFGFARDITLANFYGVSNIADAYLISKTVPIVLFGLMAAGISTAYIPMYSKIESENGTKEANKFTNNLLNVLIVIITIMVTIGLAYTEQIIKIVAVGFNGETLRLAVEFTRISILGMYFTGFLAVFNGLLQIKGNYLIPALIGFPMNILIIISIYLSTNTNILVLAIGTVLATAFQIVLIIPYVYKTGYRQKLKINFKDKYIKRMGIIAFPVMIGASVNQLNTIVDRTIASYITEGGIAALTYAERVNDFVYGIFVLSIVTVLFPLISKMVAGNNIDGLKTSVSNAIIGISVLVLPATIGVIIFSEQIVSFLYGRGDFDNKAVSMTAIALFFYSIGMVGIGYRELLFRVFYSLQDTKTPMINATVTVLLNIVLNIILSKYLGIGGLALATSLSSIICTILLYFSLKRKIGPLGMKKKFEPLIKITLASLIMGGAAKITYKLTFIYFGGANVPLLISIFAGAIIYGVTIYLMRIEDIDPIINAVKKKLSFR
ncbi:murein biosynthesis integral membrane protein MurJ [Sporosarcina highlanderae]|uniref:Probable lipid II flippase MurJ n=1 Tax=Sporosarcina highlanderae TaxID=3035916 RepID=A0ABT8JL91_9BACL|nr:murein biosynthesis integral membrane protein MurJ [Sporosarcina highlanderae]MDN4605921.1 murein biosynthesis integral membrane protein MurJ [Sporosarcina highlanderae]